MMEIFKSVWTLFKKRRRTQEKEARLGTTSPTKIDEFLEIFLKGGRAAFSKKQNETADFLCSKCFIGHKSVDKLQKRGGAFNPKKSLHLFLNLATYFAKRREEVSRAVLRISKNHPLWQGRSSLVGGLHIPQDSRIQQRAGTKAGTRDIVGTTVKLVLLVPPIQSFALASAFSSGRCR